MGDAEPDRGDRRGERRACAGEPIVGDADSSSTDRGSAQINRWCSSAFFKEFVEPADADVFAGTQVEAGLVTDRPDIGSIFGLGREIAEVAADAPCMPKRGNDVATLCRDAPRELHPRLMRGRGDLKSHDSPVEQGDVEVVGAGPAPGTSRRQARPPSSPAIASAARSSRG